MDQSMNDLDTLATLDPARDRTLSSAELIRAEADLERILATPPATEGTSRGRRFGFGLGALGSGVAAAGVLAVTMIGGTTAAYADWSPTPTAMSATQSVALANDCTESWSTPATLHARNVLLSEKRGTSQLIIVRHDGEVRLCDAIDPSAPIGWETLYSPDRSTESPAAANGIRIYGIETSGSGADAYSYDVGRVGPDVTGVDVHTAKGTVQATIESGWFVAWWPGADQDHAKSVTLHLRSGHTITAPWTRWAE